MGVINLNNPEPWLRDIKYPGEAKKLDEHDIDFAGKNSPSKNRNKPFIILVSIALVILTAFALLSYYVFSEKNKIVKNTHIKYGDIFSDEIGGLDLEIAQDRLKNRMKEFMDTKITLTSSYGTVDAKISDLGVKLDYSNSLKDIKNNAYGPYIYDSISKHFASGAEIEVDPVISIDNTVLDNFINSHFKDIDTKPQDAQLYIENNNIKIKKETAGTKLDRQRLSENIISAVKFNDNAVTMHVSSIPPEITENEVKEQIPSKIISSYKTSFTGSDSGRSTNIKLGASFLNNILLKPGEEFEYWKYIGNTTAQRGFRLAGVYLNGRVTTGIGGGLCQVSTTLYNAALLADLKITRRQAHGMPVHYVPLGLDATVDYSSLTLKFINNTGKYLLIKSNTDNNILSFSILGYMPEGKTVKVYSKSAGYNAADAYREVYMNGNLIRKDYLGRSKYKNPK